MIHTSICDVLGIAHPIVQAGMGGTTHPVVLAEMRGTNAELVAAVSEAGGLGTLGCIGKSGDFVAEEIRRIQLKTDRPFSVNFVLHKLFEDAFQAALDARVPVFTFFRGDPAEAVKRAHDVGAVTINQITTVEEAEYAVSVGVDVLIAQGREAGGHMGPMPLWSLLPEVVKVAGGRPVLAAGGIIDGQGLAAALSFGAAGVVMGTRFLATPENPTSDIHKQAILDAQVGDTIATSVWDTLSGRDYPGLQVRNLRNSLTARWSGHEDELLDVLDEVRAELKQAQDKMDKQIILFHAGEGAGRIHDLKPAGQIVRDTVAEAEEIVRRLYGEID